MRAIGSQSTVRGPFTADDGKTLADKHLIVLEIEGGRDPQAWCVYTGTQENTHRHLPGYLEFPMWMNEAAGWKHNLYYVDAARICKVPVRLLRREGCVTEAFFTAIVDRVQKLGPRRVITQYSEAAQAVVTGYRRQDRQHRVYA